MRLRGRHLLDHDALTCLLVLLFVGEPRLNTTRLHRVLRNLCYHAQTRSWVIRALLSILQRTSECKADDDRGHPPATTPTSASSTTSSPSSSSSSTATFCAPNPPPALSAGKSSDKLKRKSTTTVVCGDVYTPTRTSSDTGSGRGNQPSWLSISLDAALGCRANIFQIQRGAGKKHSSAAHTVVSIHPQAAPIICRHVLDTLISLAKNFPCQFLPQTKAKEARCADGSSPKDPSSEPNTPSQQQRSSSHSTSPARSQSKSEKSDSAAGTPTQSSSSSSLRGDRDSNRGTDTDFWDLLVRLDSLSVSRKGKGFQRLHSLSSVDNDTGMQTFESSPLGQLMMTLSHPVIRRSQLLTDRLLRLLGLVAVGLPDITNTSASETSTSTTVAMASSRGKLFSTVIINNA